MPLTAKGKKIKAAMTAEYGEKKGTSVFYASINKGKVKGAEKGGGKVSMQQMAEAERQRAHAYSTGGAVGGSGQGYGGKVMHPINHAKGQAKGRWS